MYLSVQQIFITKHQAQDWVLDHRDRQPSGEDSKESHVLDSPGGPAVKNSPDNAGDMDSIPGPGRFHILKGNSARTMQLLSPRSRVCAPQEEKPSQ